jgi:hypothetical protein
MAFIQQSLFLRQRQNPRLFEQFLGRDREAVGDLGGAVEDFQNVIAERTVKFACGSVPRGQFDPAKAGVAFGADDVAFSHAGHYARRPSPFQDDCPACFTRRQGIHDLLIMPACQNGCERALGAISALSVGEALS